MSKNIESRASISRVLVPTDFSSGALRALKRAMCLPLAPEASVRVLHVLSEDPPERYRRGVEADAGRRLKDAVRTTKALARERGHRKLEVSGELATGEPYVEIIRHSRAESADLIVVGRHGERSVRDRLIGTTAARVARKGDVPVLVVSSEPRREYRRPLIAVELKDTSSRLLELTRRLLRDEVPVMLLHTYAVPFEHHFSESEPEDSSGVRTHYRQEAAAKLAKLLEPWKASDAQWQPILKKGEARIEILAEARKRRADLVIAGTHGRSGISRVLLGSVAEWILDSASCDVLVARPARFAFELP